MFPKNIFFYWNSTDVPLDVLNNIESYKSKYKDFHIKLIYDTDLNDFSNDFPKLMKLYNKLNNYAAKSDIARLLILYRYGGLYIDCNTICIPYLEGYENNTLYDLFEKYTIK